MAAAVGAGGEPSHDIDVVAAALGVLLEPQRGGGDPFHPGFGVDHEHHREVERLRDRGGVDRPLVDTQHPLHDADVAVVGTAGVGASDPVVAREPRVERPRGAAEHRGVVAGIDEVRPCLRGHRGPSRAFERATDREGRDGLPDAGSRPREDDARKIRGHCVGRHHTPLDCASG